MSDFIQALKDNDIQIAKDMLEKGADPNQEYIATDQPNLRMPTLIEHSQGILKETAMHIAVKNNNFAICKLLFEYGANVNLRNNWLDTPLHLALENKFDEIAIFLILNGAEISPENNLKWTPLHIVKNIEIAEMLIEQGANVNAQDNFGHTPLIFASSKGNLKLCEILIRHGADVNLYTTTSALSCAAYNEHYELCKLLIKNGADVNADKEGNSPLHDAAEAGNIQICQLLIDAGSNIDSQRSSGRTPLFDAASRTHPEKSLKTMEFLLNAGANVSIRNRWGRTLKEDLIYMYGKDGVKEIIQFLELYD